MKQFLYVYFNSHNVPLDRYLGFRDEIQPEELNLSVLKSKKLTHFCVFHSTLGKSFISMIIMSFFRERTSYYITWGYYYRQNDYHLWNQRYVGLMPNLHILISTQLFSSPDSITFMTYEIFRHKKTRSVLICNSSCSILRAPISIRRKKKTATLF